MHESEDEPKQYEDMVNEQVNYDDDDYMGKDYYPFYLELMDNGFSFYRY